VIQLLFLGGIRTHIQIEWGMYSWKDELVLKMTSLVPSKADPGDVGPG
jgi:hypothetical protein